ncbi:MAG: hypothetical protein KJ721_03750 [Nanoarchaeota archaeon]|nr:hypothetical protein [Nanoarchaeota archaeon]
MNKNLNGGNDPLFETLKARIIQFYLQYYRGGIGETEQRIDLHLSLLNQRYNPLELAGLKPEDPKVVEFLTALQESFEKKITLSYVY